MNNYLKLLSPRAVQYYKVEQHPDIEIEDILDPTDLLVPYRLDVLIKIYYVDCFVRKLNMSYAVEAYKAHIYSITAFTNKENGQLNKSSQEDFIKEFNKLIESFKNGGFDSKKSLIPISKEGIILDGAHRLACAIYFRSPVTVARLNYVSFSGEYPTPIYDYNYFQKYALPGDFLDLAARIYLRYSKKNIYIACLWPSALGKEKREKALKMINESHPIIYVKKIKMSFKAHDRLISQIYMNDVWVGNINNNFKGTKNKSVLCYEKKGYSSFILFEGINKEDTLDLKEEIREVFNKGKHSIHISDNTEESIYISNYVYNNSSLNFLEKANLGKCPKLVNQLRCDNNTGPYDLTTSRKLCGFNDYVVDYPSLLNQDELKDGYTIEDILNIPYMTYTYIGKSFICADEKIVKEVFSFFQEGDFLPYDNSFADKIITNLYYSLTVLKVKIKRFVVPFYNILIKITHKNG